MSKIAFLFAGQGSQYVGMGKDLYEKYESVRKLYDKANDILGFDIKKCCFEGPSEDLIKTENTQPAIVLTSLGILEVLKEKGIDAECAAGLSLGEYSALTFGGYITFDEVLPLVRKRGKFMSEEVPEGVGAMIAVMGMSEDELEKLIKESRKFGIIAGANYNCPGQIVVGGEIKAIERLEEQLSEIGKRSVRLKVSAPFHTEMLKGAGEKLYKELVKINFKDGNKKVYSNLKGYEYCPEDDMREILKEQVYSPVLWEKIIRSMIADGVDTFIEIGPGKALSGFVKKIDRKAKVVNVENYEQLEKIKEKL